MKKISLYLFSVFFTFLAYGKYEHITQEGVQEAKEAIEKFTDESGFSEACSFFSEKSAILVGKKLRVEQVLLQASIPEYNHALIETHQQYIEDLRLPKNEADYTPSKVERFIKFRGHISSNEFNNIKALENYLQYQAMENLKKKIPLWEEKAALYSII